MSPIESGRDWGRTAPVPPDARWVGTDAEAAAIVTAARRRDQEPPPLVLTGGDMFRTLGGSGDRQRLERGEGTNVTLDVGATLIDGRLEWFLAHLVARRSWWRGRVLAVCNGGFIGEWDVAPRAHPGDGHLDVVDSRLSFVDRLQARGRLPAGRHLPHPGISTRRITAMQFEFDPDLDVYLDGRPVGRARALSVRIEAAAIDVWI